MGEWFEEDEPVYTHPRDPYTRVDILASSRHVRVEVDGVTVADSACVRPFDNSRVGRPLGAPGASVPCSLTVAPCRNEAGVPLHWAFY